MIRTGCLIACLILSAWPALAGTSAGELPEGVSIADTCTPGLGIPIGGVRMVEGRVAIVHENAPDIAYWASSECRVYQGDAVITLSDGRVSLSMQDGSTINLAAQSRLDLSESVYSPDSARARISLFHMAVGKARFWVKKLTGLRESRFQIKTRTAIIGVRGSDFIVDARNERTAVTALTHTERTVTGLPACDSCELATVSVHDYEQTVVPLGEQPGSSVILLPQDVETLTAPFVFEGDAPSLDPAGEPPPPAPAPDVVLVPDQSLIPPASMDPAPLAENPVLDRRSVGSGPAVSDAAASDSETVMEEQRQNLIEDMIKELPPLPTPPSHEKP